MRFSCSLPAKRARASVAASISPARLAPGGLGTRMLGREPLAAQGPRKLSGKVAPSTASRKLEALAGFASSPARRANPGRSHKARPKGAGPNRTGGQGNGNDEDPAFPVRREKAAEPRKPGRRLGARSQHRGEWPDHASHRGGRRRDVPDRRGAPPHGRHEEARVAGGWRLRDGRLGRRAHRGRRGDGVSKKSPWDRQSICRKARVRAAEAETVRFESLGMAGDIVA